MAFLDQSLATKIIHLAMRVGIYELWHVPNIRGQLSNIIIEYDQCYWSIIESDFCYWSIIESDFCYWSIIEFDFSYWSIIDFDHCN